METFDFSIHTPSHNYPKGDSFKFGRGYESAIKPQDPIQRTFTLKFAAMVYFLQANGAADVTTEPEINMQRLIAFYERHQMWKSFVYPHPLYGNLTVRFAEPLPVPQPIEKGNGVTEAFEIKLIEQIL